MHDGPPGGFPPMRFVGRALPRVDAPAKVAGQAAYTTDLTVPGMLVAGVVRSMVPHAHLTRVDVSGALAVPGVRRVLTFADLASVMPRQHFGPVVKDCPLLADGVVRYEGEPIALVIAQDEDSLALAIEAVEVDYDELPVLVDVEQALADDAPRLHATAEQGQFGERWADGWEPSRNVAGQYHDLRGDPDAALAAADHVFTHTYRLPPVHHFALERFSTLVVPGPDSLTVYAGNQYPYLMVKLLADLFGLAESAVRVVIPYVGGSFGSKEYMIALPLAAVAARATNQPVRLVLGQEEGFRSSTRHGATVTVTSGVSSAGDILARKVTLYFDTGAYADQGPRVVRQGGYRSPGPYRIPNVQVDAHAVYTNKVPAGAYRGFGASQPIFAFESHMDEIAAALGLDPFEFRMRNLLHDGEEFNIGDLPLECDLPGSLQEAVRQLGRPGPRAREDGRLGGVGLAVGLKNSASGKLPASAIVRLHPDGSATVLVSTVEMGQGAHGAFLQIAAETLGLPIERLRITPPDTAVTPFDQRTSSSRSTVHAGLAIQRAAEDAIRQLLRAAADVLGVDPSLLETRDGAVHGGQRRLTWAQVINGATSPFGGEIIGNGHVNQADTETPNAFGMRAGYWEGSVGAAEVAVDPDTGEVEVVRYLTVGDAGRVINPLSAHGQEEGGVVMALGTALFESCDFENGALLNGSLIDYRLPTALDAPADLHSVLFESGKGPGPYGSKGLGESSIITVAPAIANAVFWATGRRIRDLPLSPARVWRALQEG